MTPSFIALFTLTWLLCMAWLYFIMRFSSLLKLRAPAVHAALGTPTTSLLDIFRNPLVIKSYQLKWQLSGQQNFANMKLVFYILSGKFYTTNDPTIIKYASFMRVYFISVTILIIATVSAAIYSI